MMVVVAGSVGSDQQLRAAVVSTDDSLLCFCILMRLLLPKFVHAPIAHRAFSRSMRAWF